MAQTLEELFRNKVLDRGQFAGKTAADGYAVRNSKDIRISTSDPLVNNTGFGPARLLRKTLGVKGSESFLEEEATGIRIIRGFSTPVIYGNEIGRITLRTTPTLDLIKTATYGELGDDGGGLIGQGLGKLTGGKVKSLSGLRDKINTKLGIPQTATPTFVVNGLSDKTKINLGLTQNRMNDLATIKQSAEGSLLGKLLKEGGGGNLKTIGKQALGSAIKLGKQTLRKKLFGGNERTGFEVEGYAFGGRSVTGFTEESAQWYNTINVNYGSNENANPKNDPTTIKVDKDGAPYSKTIFPNGDTAKDRNDLSYKQQLQFEPIKFTQEPERAGKGGRSTVGKLVIPNYDKRKNLENSKRGFYTTKDSVNELGIVSGPADNYPTANDDLDFVPLKFHSIANEKTIQFRCTVSGLNESFSPSWDSHKFLGSPFSNYTYSGIERTVTFNFKVYSLNANEHKKVWDKINFLTGLVYPQGYATSTALIPPFIRFTLGDLFKNKAGFIESLSYTYDDNTPWNISNKEKTLNDGGKEPSLSGDINMVGYRLPMIVDVATTIKFVEGRNDYPSTEGTPNKFFTFNPVT